MPVFWCHLAHSTSTLLKEFTARMATHGSDVRLSEDDKTFLLSLLRNATTPLTTEQLVEALKQRGK
jgi:hypothetical protein